MTVEARDPSDNEIEGLAAAPEFYVEGYRGTLARAGVVKLNFFSLRFDPGAETVRKHAVVTLTMPAGDLADVARGMLGFIEDLRRKGVIVADGTSETAR